MSETPLNFIEDIKAAVSYHLFEPNNEYTRQQIKSSIWKVVFQHYVIGECLCDYDGNFYTQEVIITRKEKEPPLPVSVLEAYNQYVNNGYGCYDDNGDLKDDYRDFIKNKNNKEQDV